MERETGKTVTPGRGRENNKKMFVVPKSSDIVSSLLLLLLLLSVQNATFAVSVSGVGVVTGPMREEVQRRCQDILNWEGSV